MVLMVLPSRLTVIFLDLASTTEIWLRPMVNVTDFRCSPYTPGLPSIPSRSMRSVTLVPGFQYSSGRKSSRSLPNQWPSIGTDGEALTFIPFSTSAGWVIPRVKWSETGMPTPTVVPSSGV